MAWNALGSAQEKNVHPDFAGEQSKRLREVSVQDEVDDDAIVDELTNSPEKKRRLTVDQVNFLELSFNADLKLEPERKALIAKQLGLRPRQVAIWFQNRRARWKNKQLEQDYDSLKAKHEAVLKENQSLLKENESMIMENKKLKDEVARLTALLQTVEKNDMADPIDDIVTSRLTGRDMVELKDEQLSGKSGLTSPSKSSDEQSEIQDSGQSSPTCEEGVAIVEPALGELNSTLACSALKFEVECPPLYMTDEILFNPLLFQQLATNGVCLEDACNLLFNLEDQLHGLAWGG